MVDMTCKIAGITFKNPIVMASGTFGFGKEYAQFYDLSMIGGIALKGLTLRPRCGNSGPRIYETASGLLNSVGLENPGIKAFLEQDLDELGFLNTVLIANLGGGSLQEYVLGAKMLTDNANKRRALGLTGISMIELNISCPNVKEGGMAFGIETEAAREVVREVRQATELPLAVKLSPNARDIVAMAVMCEEEGADAVSLVNTFTGMKIDVQKKQSVFANLYAGLSGPAIKPIALRMVHQVAQHVNIPVIGMGGITSAEDAVEFIMAGASIVQIGTYNFMNLRAGEELVRGLEQYMEREKIKTWDEIRGVV